MMVLCFIREDILTCKTIVATPGWFQPTLQKAFFSMAQKAVPSILIC